jgi:Asp-tRNA(Asn)/Glu-tRNA(Gln) amidotransferase A subunit family amidase
MDLSQLTAAQAALEIREGRVTSRELVQACLDRIAAYDGEIQAWAHLDPEYALTQADKRDEDHRAGILGGPLHGVPVGVKDIFDTDDMPTECGTPLLSGRRPVRDASVVALLREAGAVILGKTVTTELAVYAPGKTRNPHDPKRTPGGSSSGSAAAVASFMVPLAVGSQTNGSVIRPASYCGVFGYKPSFGLISRHGALEQCPTLDQVGVFARTVEDAALVAECVMRFDENDEALKPHARPDLLGFANQEPPLPPLFAFVKSPVWDKADEDTQEAFAELVEALGDRAATVELPDIFNKAVDCHRTIMYAEIAKSYGPFYEKGGDQISPQLRAIIEEGQEITAADYLMARAMIPRLNAAVEEDFDWFDAYITPATTGIAPLGLESTGSPIFCTIWTLCGMPAITIPILQNGDGLPMGVQLVGRRGQDAKLLRTARWLANFAEE